MLFFYHDTHTQMGLSNLQLDCKIAHSFIEIYYVYITNQRYSGFLFLRL